MNSILNRAGLSLAALALAGAASAAGTPKPVWPGHQLMSQARLSLDQARAIALQARPGKVVNRELEKEAGGSGLRYSFDIKVGHKLYEVGVDANDGKVLENGAEGRDRRRT